MPADPVRRAPKKRRGSGPSALAVHLVGGTLLLGFFMLVFWRYMFVTILPGHIGVLYSWFFGGTQVSFVYGEGVRLKWPWNRIYILETRIQTRDDEILALSQEGMEVRVKLSSLFSINPEKAGQLLKDVGPNYEERIVRPLVIGQLRRVVSRYNSTELFTIHFLQLRSELYQAIEESHYSSLIIFHDLLIREILLPRKLTQAIDEKLAQEQLAASYLFRLESERQAAEQKRIRALGIQNFYSIVSDALNKNLLTWRGIEATVELAQSPNAKVVIVGGGENQLPLILGADMLNLQPPPAVAPLNDDTAPALELNDLPKLFPAHEADSLGVRETAIGVNDDDKVSTAGAKAAPSDDTKAQQTEPSKSAPATPAQTNRDTSDQEGLVAPAEDGQGLTSESYPGEGTRKVPLDFINQKTPESSPYGIRDK